MRVLRAAIGCGLSIAAILAFVWISGCGHSQTTTWPATEQSGVTLSPGQQVNYRLTALLNVINNHAFDVIFGNAMDEQTVEIVVADDQGNEVSDTNTSWSLDHTTMHIRAPFAYCRTYVVTIKAGSADTFGDAWTRDATLSTTIGKNPFDLDGSSACTAEVIISPLFMESADAAIFTGETIQPEVSVQGVSAVSLSRAGTWYVDGSQDYTGATRMARISSYNANGAVGLAKFFCNEVQGGGVVSTDCTLYIWDAYNPASPSFATSLDFSAGEVPWSSVHGPYDAGDLNGDGIHEILISEDNSTSELDRQQSVIILPGDIAHGSGLSLEGTALLEQTVGHAGETLLPFIPIGDVDGDGKDDLAAIHYTKLANGKTQGWQVWVAHGATNLSSLFYGAKIDKLTDVSNREIVDIDSGDFNGDGISDLVTADLQRMTVNGTSILVNPHVDIFFGGKGTLANGKISLFDAQVEYVNSSDTRMAVRNLGDINGDGFDDLGILIEELDGNENVSSSAIYIIYGGETWYKHYGLNGTNLYRWNVKITADAGESLVLKDDYWDPRVGDVNNDGFDDFMIKMPTRSGFDVLWFLGNSGFAGNGKSLTPGDAAATWSIYAPQQ